MDTLSGMRLFTKVVETGGFSAAGRQVGVNASSVSRLVAGSRIRSGPGCSTARRGISG